jgi:putative NADH-flavin reductase
MVCPECRLQARRSNPAKETTVPVIIIGADTPLGPAVLDALAGRDGEVRAFIGTIELLDELRARGVKTALGDVSDGTHVAGAALNAFAAVLLADAATDDRERSFADTPMAVYDQWADGLGDAGVTRVIWVGDQPIPEAIAAAAREHASVVTGDRDPAEIAAEVARLDEVADLSSESR